MKSDPDLYGYLIILFLNLILLGLFQSFTTALDSTSQSRLKKFADENERYLKRLDFTINLIERPLKYQFSVKLFSLLIFSYSYLILWKMPYNYILLSILWVMLVVTFSILLSSKIALLHSERIAFKCCYFVYGLHIISIPLFWISKTIVNIILILFKQDIDIENKFFSEDEVMSMLEVGKESGIIKEEGRKMISSIFNFDDELAYEIMTPRTDVFAIDILEPTSEYIDKLMELRYSRIPVYEDDYDNIIGILNIKDYLIKAREAGFERVDIRGILREPYFVPETKNIDSLFFELQKTKNHIAVLIDEYGGFSGIVTMEDIVEEIVGDIDDEYDEDAHVVNKIDKNTFIIDGNVSLDDLEEDYGIILESDSSETIGGFIIDNLGEIPTESDLGKEVDFGSYKITITSIKERRIDKVKLVVTETKEDAEDEECGE